MKIFLGIVLAAVALNGVLASPARLPSEDAEEIELPRRSYRPIASRAGDDADDEGDFHDFKGVIDTGSGYPFLQPVPHPFSFNMGFFDSFEDIFRRLRTRLWPLQSAGAANDDSDEDADGFSFKLNPKKGNTTSTVKVVDGHKIEINDTVYGDDTSVFKVRVVNIRPLESGEDVGNTDNAESDTGKAAAATSAPSNAKDNADDSDERREPLENKNVDENEIKGNIDDPELAVAIEMLPTTSPNDAADDVANINAEFVTDNTLGNGSVEPETNKAAAADQDDMVETAVVPALQNEDDAESAGSHLLYNEPLTVEDNNGDAADNFNESNDEHEQLLKDMNSMQATAAADAREEAAEAADVEDNDEDIDDVDELTAELDEDDDDIEQDEDNTPDNDAVNAEFDAESISISQENQNEDGADKSTMKHSNYAANKHREDVSSSDDENEAAVVMSAPFNSEWGSLAEDLGHANDADNNLSNDIDIYDVVPIDLSNDLAVNDIAASQSDFPINPDAEFVDVAGVITTGDAGMMMPKFEKLSMGAALNY